MGEGTVIGELCAGVGGLGLGLERAGLGEVMGSPEDSRVRIISLGGGVQSTALVVLAAQGRIDFPVAVMSNVGDDSENPATLPYVRDVLMPFADRHMIKVQVIEARPITLLEEVRSYNGCQRCGAESDDECRDGCPSRLGVKTGRYSIPIPLKIEPERAPLLRSCTKHYKVLPISRWTAAAGATADDPATVALGISVDEIQRASSKQPVPHERRVYPLLDLRLSRNDCRRIITDAGLPVPPKSSCWFCPFTPAEAWSVIRRDDPVRFAAAVELEAHVNTERDKLGKNRVYLTSKGVPLADAAPEAQQPLFGGDSPDGCDEGWCWT